MIEFEKYMQLAMLEAKKAQSIGEVPIGALIVSEDGQVLAASFNQVETNQTQVAHAEILALMAAGQKTGDWRLPNATLYSTLEPCAMCMSAIILSRIKRVVFAASSPIFGYRVDKQIGFTLYNCPIEIHEGILAGDARALLKDFFESCRRSNGD
jgi:tRNA(adenine34) deaminase